MNRTVFNVGPQEIEIHSDPDMPRDQLMLVPTQLPPHIRTQNEAVAWIAAHSVLVKGLAEPK